MKKLFLTIMILVGAVSTRAAIQTKVVEYKQGDTTLEGVIIYDDAVKAELQVRGPDRDGP